MLHDLSLPAFRSVLIILLFVVTTQQLMSIETPHRPISENLRQQMAVYLKTIKKFQVLQTNPAPSSDTTPLSPEANKLVAKLRSLNSIVEARAHGDYIAICMIISLLKYSITAPINEAGISGFHGLADACKVGMRKALMFRGMLRYRIFLDDMTNYTLRNLVIADFRHGFENILITQSLPFDGEQDTLLAKIKVYDHVMDRPYRNALADASRSGIDDELLLLTYSWSYSLGDTKETIYEELKATPIDDQSTEKAKALIPKVRAAKWDLTYKFLYLLNWKAREDTEGLLSSYDVHLAARLVVKMQKQVTEEINNLVSFIPELSNDSKACKLYILPYPSQLHILWQLWLASTRHNTTLAEPPTSTSTLAATGRAQLLMPYLKNDPHTQSLINIMSDIPVSTPANEAVTRIYDALQPNTSLPSSETLLQSEPENHTLNYHLLTDYDPHANVIGWYIFSHQQNNLTLHQQVAANLMKKIENTLILSSSFLTEKTSAQLQTLERANSQDESSNIDERRLSVATPINPSPEAPELIEPDSQAMASDSPSTSSALATSQRDNHRSGGALRAIKKKFKNLTLFNKK